MRLSFWHSLYTALKYTQLSRSSLGSFGVSSKHQSNQALRLSWLAPCPAALVPGQPPSSWVGGWSSRARGSWHLVPSCLAAADPPPGEEWHIPVCVCANAQKRHTSDFSVDVQSEESFINEPITENQQYVNSYKHKQHAHSGASFPGPPPL